MGHSLGSVKTASVLEGRVTVVIPVHNGERFIRRALDSVLSQTYPATQIIVVDDGSSDSTREIVQREYGKRVTLICQRNGGVAKARNVGLRAAVGNFIALLDADDWWQPQKLAEQVRVFGKHPTAVVNYTGLRIVRDDGEHLTDTMPAGPATLASTLRWCNPGVVPSSVMLRRSALESLGGGFDERRKGCEDWELWRRLVGKGIFCACAEPLTSYRASNTGLSGDADHMFRDFLGMLDDVLLADMRGVHRKMWRRRIISYQAYKASMTARGAGDHATERKYMWKSLREWPSPLWTRERFRFFAVTVVRTTPVLRRRTERTLRP